ncbi:MAG: VCBS repeat-containing protein, partial [Thermoplasmata archaeon]|nr:VCBS repeat-containing protein [Thermoplasmata archaeon]
DAVVSDLNGDGFMDVVFAQEKEASNDYIVNSTLFWGSASGWNATADVQIVTTGATGVLAVDINKDGLDDLVFSCFRDSTTTATNSMVFYQTASGYDGSDPDLRLPTRGARGVAAGDIDGNGWVDLVFANSLSGGFVDIFSFVYWGESGGFAISPTNLPTHGAEGVLVANVDGDTNLDVIFACSINNSQSRVVDSFVYLGDGTRSIGPSADFALPTLGATSVAVADLDGTGWSDLVFSCENDGATYEVNSRVFLGGASGYGSGPDIELPTNGASGVAVAHVIAKDVGGYLSKVITPEEPVNSGVFETFKYNAINLPGGHTGTIQVLDSTTGELLAETALMTGANEWSLADKFRIREHEAILIMVVVDGLDPGAGFAIDDLWLNWSPRNRASPLVLGLEVSDDNVLRTHSIDATINVTDEYDFLDELSVKLEHRLSGTSDPWVAFMISDLGFRSGSWRASIAPRVDIPVGVYELRVMVTDSDKMDSGWKLFTEMYEVINNLPTAPEIHIDPGRATTTSPLTASIDISASDVESPSLVYNFYWYLDDVLVPNLTMEDVPSSYLTRGQNWTVEVRAFDGDDEGPAGIAWKLIVNAKPMVIQNLVPPELVEDTPDSRWTDLSSAFGDPDGDVLTYRVDPPASYFTVDIDQETGIVTYTPEDDWWGTEEITFWASDGEFEVSQTVTVNVLPVNDPAFFIMVAGQPYTTDDIYLEVDQDETLVIEVLAFDVEDDDLLFRVTTTQVSLDLSNGWLEFSPTNDNVGWLNFSLSVNDNIDLDDKMWANFTVLVLNINDPVDVPRIISPSDGMTYKWNESVGLRGVCTDPDTKHGQELTYSWTSNVSGDLGIGQNINFRFTESGAHQITLTVSDGVTSEQILINITVSAEPVPPPPPPPNGEETGLSMVLLLGIVVAIVVALLIAFLVVKRRNAALEAPIPLTEEEKKRLHLEKMAVAVKETADQWEAERASEKAADEGKIAVTGTGMVPSDDGAHKMRLTETASAETAKLWSDVGTEESIVDDAEKEALRKETEKRKVQSAIQALPYGIPAPALRHIQPQML